MNIIMQGLFQDLSAYPIFLLFGLEMDFLWFWCQNDYIDDVILFLIVWQRYEIISKGKAPVTGLRAYVIGVQVGYSLPPSRLS